MQQIADSNASDFSSDAASGGASGKLSNMSSTMPSTLPTTLPTIRERVIANEDRLAEAASEIFLLSSGRVIRQPAFPHVFDANVIRHPHLEGDDLDGALHRLGSPLRAIGARHLQINCDATPLPDGIQAGLKARGFHCDRLLAMALPGKPARRPSPHVEVRRVPDEAPFEQYAEIMERLSQDEPWYSPAVSREIIGSLAAKATASELSLYVARMDGRPVGALAFSADEATGVGTIMTVGTIPEARNRGVAQTMVVTLATQARQAGCDLIYLIARADDTPKELYRKLGFAVAFSFEVWLRPPR